METFSNKHVSLTNKTKKAEEQLKHMAVVLDRLEMGVKNLSEAVNVMVNVIGQDTYEAAMAEYRLQVTEANVAKAMAEGVIEDASDTVLADGQKLIFQVVERMKDTDELIPPGRAYLEFDTLTPDGKALLAGATVGTKVVGSNGNSLEITKVFSRGSGKPAPAAPPKLAMVADAEVEPAPEA